MLIAVGGERDQTLQETDDARKVGCIGYFTIALVPARGIPSLCGGQLFLSVPRLHSSIGGSENFRQQRKEQMKSSASFQSKIKKA